MKKILLPLLFIGYCGHSQTTITVDPSSVHGSISPYIYGKNNSTSDRPSNPTSASNWTLYNDAGIRIFRENGGNNCTKYNWREKISSHPNWYNNVYDHDWDYEAQQIHLNTNAQSFHGFQLIGKVASNKNNNFDDWGYNNSNWWSGVNQNLAGGGSVITEVPLNVIDGNPALYTQDWPADSTAAILDHWIDNLGMDSTRFRYWNMDNEPTIWGSTHDDVYSGFDGEDYVQKYVEVAKKVRAKFPGIKLVGPAFTNEWQWYEQVTDTSGTDYPWFEYFIKRIAEEQAVAGVRLLDVLDYHLYPHTEGQQGLTLEMHKIFYDKTWDYPQANGIKRMNGGWNNDLTKEYIFARSDSLMDHYFGPGHGITLGMSETGAIDNDPNVVACWYASHLGTFANNGVELFTPWSWYVGEHEVLHLFSNYYGDESVSTISSNADLIGSYASLSDDQDSLMLVLVNKDTVNSQSVTVNLQNFSVMDGSVNGFEISGLPGSETFVSASNNALQSKVYSISSNSISTTLPSLSVTMIRLRNELISGNESAVDDQIVIHPNPSKDHINVSSLYGASMEVELYNTLGVRVANGDFQSAGIIKIEHLQSGVYIIRIKSDDTFVEERIIKQ